MPPAPDGSREGYVAGPEDQRLRLVERNIDLGDEGHYLVAVAGDAAEITDETRSFDQALIITFSILAVVLLLTTMFQVRFGLAPLKRITDSLAAIRSGSAEHLAGQFPEEIAPLARETNALIDANKEIVERARTHVGNLAHALKTPLSVMVNEASARARDPFAIKVLEQADIMRDQVARHLERARLAARLTVVGSITDVAPVVTALARTMEKIHHDRGVAIEVRADARGALPRRAAGSGRDDRQPGGQCLQVGDLAGGDRGDARAPRSGERRAGLAHRGRRRRPRAVAVRARAGRASAAAGWTRPSRARVLGLSIVVELASSLRRRTQARHRADRRLARRTGAAGGVSRLSSSRRSPDFRPNPPVS